MLSEESGESFREASKYLYKEGTAPLRAIPVSHAPHYEI